MISTLPYSKAEEAALRSLRGAIEEAGSNFVFNCDVEATDEFLLIFLRCRNLDVPSAFHKLQKLIDGRRKKYAEIFSRMYPSALYPALDKKGGGVLKSRDALGRHVIYLKANAWDTDLLNMDDILQALAIIVFEMLSFKETQVNGIVVIIDGKGFGLKHMKHISPTLVQKYTNFYLTACPLKIKAIHILNAPKLFNMAVSLVKMFLTQKLRKRYYTHGNSMDSLHKFISPEILPDTFGGTLTEEEAVDHKLVDDLYTQEKEDYYRSLLIKSEGV